jgi:hypothetical protein
MAVPTYRETYALGLFARRVTIRSQQVRGLNLIHALLATRRIGPGSSLLVVGAGFGGLTAAAAAVRSGCRVTVVERTQSRLSLQRNCRHRFLHPHIYDWPFPGFRDPDAGLPILNWRADTADAVVRQIDSEIDALRSVGLSEVFAVDSVTVTQKGIAFWREKNANRTCEFEAVVLAVGYGLERDGPGAISYWADIPIDMDTSDGSAKKVLISGSGDGAITDLTRACLVDSRQDKVMDLVLSAPNIDAVTQRVIEIENSLDSGDPEYLSSQYQDQGLDLRLTLPRRKWDVFWAPGSASMFTPNSSALNRFIAAQLFHAGAFTPLIMSGRTEKVTQSAGGGYEVVFSEGASERFNIVVQRHGPVSRLPNDFPSLANACASLKDTWRPGDSDWTNRVLLENENFGGVSAKGATPTPDPIYEEDLRRVKKFGYKISSVADRETVFVVVGTGLWQELLDRPAACIVQAAVNDAGKSRTRRAIILPYDAWRITPEIHDNPVISVGGPNVNSLTDLLKDNNQYSLGSGVFGSWELRLGVPQVALWGESAYGTQRAVSEYIRRPEGLANFLRQCWK